VGVCAIAADAVTAAHTANTILNFIWFPHKLKQFPPDLNLRDSQTVSDDGDSVH
jgi:hypothetical protein